MTSCVVVVVAGHLDLYGDVREKKTFWLGFSSLSLSLSSHPASPVHSQRVASFVTLPMMKT